MKKTCLLIAALALPAAAFARIDPTRPMLTGHGNVDVRPARLIVTNQTAGKSDDTVKLEKLVITGSLIKQPTQTAARRR